MEKILIIYCAILCFITFFAFWVDKRKAIKNRHRISERTLLTLCLLGGALGGIFAMYTFRHKTLKKRFYLSLPFMLTLHICVIIYVIAKLG